jgi:hypothetical protein
MISSSPINLSSRQIKMIINKNKINELKLQKNIQSSTSQTYGENQMFFERKVLTKASTPLSYINKKYKKTHENVAFISKTRRINKYNPNALITKKELIIDTRNEYANIVNKQRKKASSNDLKNKRYQIYKTTNLVKIDKNLQINTNIDHHKTNVNNSKNNINEENNHNYQTQMGYYSPLNNKGHLIHFSHPKVTNSLYTILAMRKNQFMDAYNEAKEKEKEFLPKVKQLQFLMDKTPMANFFSKKKDVRTFISPTNSPLPYISLLNDDYSISEKIRFQKIMDKLAKLKKCIEDNPKKEYCIAKEFLLSIGLYDVENFDIEKLNNFIDFVKGSCLINPSKNIKENILDILRGSTVIQPPISDVMDDKKLIESDEKKLMEDNQKIKKFIADDNIQTNNKDIVKTFKNPPDLDIKQKESKFDNNKNTKNEKNSKIKLKKIKKSHRVESVERLMTKKYQEVERNNSYSNLNEKEREIVLNYRGLPINLKRQKEIEKINNDVNLDLVIKPEHVINMLEKKFKDEERANNDMRAKTYASWTKSLREGKNPKLYGGKRNNSDYEELKKRNMLTEYICLMKAKNNYEISKLKEKYKV